MVCRFDEKRDIWTVRCSGALHAHTYPLNLCGRKPLNLSLCEFYELIHGMEL